MSDQPPHRIEALRSAVYPSFAMLAGMQLDLFTVLAAGPQTAQQLATTTDSDMPRLRVLLYALVNAGLLTVEGELFANTSEAGRYLVTGREGCVAARHNLWSELWQALLHTADSIRNGRPEARKDFSNMSAEELRGFFSGLHPGAIAEGRAFASQLTGADQGPVVDVAGGSGGFAIGLAQALPQLTITVTDLPQVIPHTSYFIDEADAATRISVVAADVVDRSLSGDFGVAMLRNFIQVLAPDQIARALAHVLAALRPGGTIYISGDILDDSRLSPTDTVAFNLVFINIYDAGQAYTEAEYRSRLQQAGFGEIERLDADLMRARRPT